MSLGARLKKFRLQKNESLQDVADAVKVSKAHMWDLETGNSRNPSLELLSGLAKHYGVSVAKLVGEDVSDLSETEMVMFRDLKGLNDAEREFIVGVIETMKKKRESADGKKDKSD